jgi:hypothetical protein
MKTAVLILIGALSGGAVVYFFLGPTRVESVGMTEHPDASRAPNTAYPEHVAADSSRRDNPDRPVIAAVVATEAVVARQSGTRVEHTSPPIPPEAFDALDLSAGEGRPRTQLQMLHDQFTNEVTDPSWSANVQPQVEGHLKTEDMMKLVDLVSLGCRKTLCEIRAASPSIEMNAQSEREFQIRVANMSKEQWWSAYGFRDPALRIGFGPDGRVVMVAYLSTRELQ